MIIRFFKYRLLHSFHAWPYSTSTNPNPNPKFPKPKGCEFEAPLIDSEGIDTEYRPNTYNYCTVAYKSPGPDPSEASFDAFESGINFNVASSWFCWVGSHGTRVACLDLIRTCIRY